MANAQIKAIITAEDRASAAIGGFAGAVERVGDRIQATARHITLALKIATVAAATFSLKSAAAYEQNRIAFDTMLGSAEEGAKMMKRLSDFARKTPFDLPGVVEGAQRLLAFDIEAEKLLPTLKALGNIAAGVGKDKLPQLILAFGQVRAAGKLTGNELRQFTEAGVPLLDLLAKQAGKSAAEIKQAMENGAAPSFQEVEKAVFSASQEGGKFFNLMERQSTTFSGVMQNLQDQMGRVARNIVGISDTGDIKQGSIFARLSTAGQNLLNWLDQNSAKIESKFNEMLDGTLGLIDRVVAGFESGGLRGALSEVSKIIEEFADKVNWEKTANGFTQGLFRLLFAIDWEKFAAEAIKLVIKVTPKIIDGIISGLIQTALHSPMDMVKFILAIGFLPVKVVSALTRVLKAIPIVGPMASWMLRGMASVARFLLAPIRKLFSRIGKRIMEGVSFGIGQGKNKVAALFGDMLNLIIQKGFSAIGNVTRIIGRMLDDIAGFFSSARSRVIDSASKLFDGVKTIFSSLLDSVVSKISLVIEHIKSFFGSFALNIGLALGKAVGYILRFVIETVPSFIVGVIRWFKTLPGAIWNVFTNVFNTISGWLASASSNAISLVSGMINAIINFFKGLPGQVGSILSSLWQAVVNGARDAGVALVRGFVNGMKFLVNELRSGLSFVFDKVGQFLSGVGHWLVDSGRALIRGFVTGIKSVAGEPANAVKDVVKKVRDWLPGSPAKKGPFSGRGWTPYRGKALVEGFAEGIRSSDMASDAAQKLSSDVSSHLNPFGAVRLDSSASSPVITPGGTRAGSTPVASATTTPINITIQAGAFMGTRMDARKYAVMIMGAYNDAMKAQGLA